MRNRVREFEDAAAACDRWRSQGGVGGDARRQGAVAVPGSGLARHTIIEVWFWGGGEDELH
jgi:hypothetical protein